MRKPLLITLCIAFLALASLGLTGCSSPAPAAIGGALAGGAATNTIAGIQADLETARQAKLAELAEAVAALDQATDETQKEVLAAEITKLNKAVADLEAAQTAAELTKEGLEVDWSDPAEIGAFGGGILALIGYWLKRRQATEATAKYQAHKQGVESYAKHNPDSAAGLYDSIGDARVKKGVT